MNYPRERNSNWKGDKATYFAIHRWINKNYGKAKKCRCGSVRFVEWALKKGKKHSHNIKNYLQLCSSCHKRYDYTQERKEKMRKVMTGRTHTWGDKISKALKGRKLSEECKKKLSVYNKKHPRERNKKGQFFKK